ncbi:type IV pilus twitching motility protein PilT [Colibacter massiliensis]|uniref:type IV pilus twitching motility protein PilT n=1 Tax=Colibacter massiliensis TaxID=1852379 RepID=UPI002354040D|nr:ATPase, T2SS/T4P/T4SS family [Colibacter massiliensis]
MDIDALLRTAAEMRAGDLHLQEGRQPLARRNDDLVPVAADPIGKEDMLSWLASRHEELRNGECLSFSFVTTDGLRCRAHWSTELAGIHGVLRLLYPLGSLPDDEDMDILTRLSRLRSGLVLAVGATGSGKTTTLWRMLTYLNTHRACHIITLEDPVEYVVSGEKALIAQREWKRHFTSFAAAVKEALRQDPDVILVGEMRDAATMEAALTAAETGHLVFSSLHTQSAAQTITRIIGMAESGQENFLRYRLSLSLQAILAQQRRFVNGTMHIYREILTRTPAVAQLIRSGKEHQLQTLMQTGGAEGMRTMEQALRKDGVRE